jgi:hypothetical protein
MPVQPDKPKLVTVFRDRHAEGSQPTIDRHLGGRRDHIRRAFIVSSLGEARPESHLAMPPANRGMKALAAEEFNVDVQDGAVAGSNSSPLRDSLGQLVEVADRSPSSGACSWRRRTSGVIGTKYKPRGRNLIAGSTSFFAESSRRTRTSPSSSAATGHSVAAS